MAVSTARLVYGWDVVVSMQILGQQSVNRELSGWPAIFAGHDPAENPIGKAGRDEAAGRWAEWGLSRELP